jgi:Tfp pilus assembly protein PilN
MQNELTNLLPENRQRALRRGYFLRLGVVVIIFLILLTCAAAVLLLPTYIFLTESARTKEFRLESVESAVSSQDESALSTQLSTISDDYKILGMLAETPSVSATIRAVLAISRPGITLSGFSYSLADDKNSNILTISGIAATRDALRSYQLALQSAPFVTSADLPVSVYAKDTDIDFTITVTLSQSTLAL